MLTEKHEAAAPTTAPKSFQRKLIYHNRSTLSSSALGESLAEQLAHLLFYLQFPLREQERRKGWSVFEAKLRDYVELRMAEDLARDAEGLSA
ncbi:MAG TPA: hypothetical protein VMX13_01755 [Sedimentisphaerales bacterium]|nr:hypothetical protein [Sedimentisphaerales bacterium]